MLETSIAKILCGLRPVGLQETRSHSGHSTKRDNKQEKQNGHIDRATSRANIKLVSTQSFRHLCAAFGLLSLRFACSAVLVSVSRASNAGFHINFYCETAPAQCSFGRMQAACTRYPHSPENNTLFRGGNEYFSPCLPFRCPSASHGSPFLFVNYVFIIIIVTLRKANLHLYQLR